MADENKCPHPGGIYGNNCNDFDECDKCCLWDGCMKLHESQIKELRSLVMQPALPSTLVDYMHQCERLYRHHQTDETEEEYTGHMKRLPAAQLFLELAGKAMEQAGRSPISPHRLLKLTVQDLLEDLYCNGMELQLIIKKRET